MAIFIVELFTFFILRSNVDSKTTLPWPQGGAVKKIEKRIAKQYFKKVRKCHEGTIIYEFMTEKNVQGGWIHPPCPDYG